MCYCLLLTSQVIQRNPDIRWTDPDMMEVVPVVVEVDVGEVVDTVVDIDELFRREKHEYTSI